MRYYFKDQENVSALVQIFNAIPSPSFSAPAELRMINPNLWTLSSVNPSLKPLKLSCSIHPRRQYGDVPYGDTLYFNICFLSMINYRVSLNGTSPIVTLEGQFRKAKSSMSLRHFPAPSLPFYFPSLWNNTKY